MKTKPYNLHEEESQILREPAIAYGSVDKDALLDADFSELGDHFRPFNQKQAEQWIAQAEANIRAGKVTPSETAFANLEQKYPWLCK